MLTLAGSLHFDRLTAYRDVVRRAGSWVTTSTFYVLADTPRIALDAGGDPLFDFLWYRMPAGESSVPAAGGMLSVTMNLAPSPDERTALIERLQDVVRAEGLGPVELLSLPVSDGTVELTFAGGAGGDGLTATVAGAGPVMMSGNEHAAFAMELSRDGAALLWEALENGRDLLHARYDLVFQHVLGDVELRVWCEAKQSHSATASRLTAGNLNPRSLRESLVAQHLAGIDLRSETPLSEAHRRALEDVADRVLETALADALFRFDQTAAGAGLVRNGRLGALRPFNESMSTTLNLAFRESYPVNAHAIVQDVVAVGRTRAQLGDRVRQVDVRGGARMLLDVTFHCTVDFGLDLIDVVKVRLDYEGTTPSGPIHRTGEVIFREGQSLGHFRTDLASADQRSYKYEAQVYYRGSDVPTRLTYPQTDASIVVLDLDHLGALTVTVELGEVSFENVRTVAVDLEHPATGQSKQFSLDATRPSDTWRAVIRDTPARYRYRATWVTNDDRRVEDDWRESSAPHVRLDAPPSLGFGARRSIQLVATGDFASLAQILAEVRLVAPPGASRTEFAFTATGQTAVWDVLLDPAQELRYELKRTVMYRDGTRRESAWRETDAPVCLLRDDARLDVRIVTRLLALGGDVLLALLSLEPVDSPDAERTTIPLRDAADAQWSFRVSDPEHHRYRYQLTLVARDGHRTALPWQDAHEELLVLRPPA